MGEGDEKCQRQEEGRVRQAWQDDREREGEKARGVTVFDPSMMVLPTHTHTTFLARPFTT